VRAANVINATGVWADRIRPEELHSEAEVPRIAPSRGTHVTIAAGDLPLDAGAIVPAGEGRSIFALPWLGGSLAGTTDNNYDGDIDHVRPSEQDIDYVGEPADPEALPRVEGVAEHPYDALAARYRHAAEDVLALAARDPRLARPIVEGHPDLLAEARFAARREQARTVGDVLLRRCRPGILAGAAVRAARSRLPACVAETLAQELGWDRRRVGVELERFAAEAAAAGIGVR
jgi:glycerol-3-phosphate dehydrogenase